MSDPVRDLLPRQILRLRYEHMALRQALLQLVPESVVEGVLREARGWMAEDKGDFRHADP